jgi:DNA-binding transcriptional ArsR family regulator
MIQGPYIAEIAALIGDPARANMLAALVDGRELTAKELAFAAHVAPSTASAHLARLLDGELLAVTQAGRTRSYRLKNALVANAIEALMVLAVHGPRRHRPAAALDQSLRFARTCYDHLAGALGVQLTEAMVARGVLGRNEGTYRVTRKGEKLFGNLGLHLDDLMMQRRAFARPCLDWSERRHHLAGALGAALVRCYLEMDWLKRLSGTRAVALTLAGREGFQRVFRLDLGTEFGAGPLSGPAAAENRNAAA